MMKAFKRCYANSQWAVVPCGLYCREMEYLWEAADIATPDWNGGGKLSHCLLHIGSKTWVDADALVEAAEMALLIHDPDGFKKLDWPASVKALQEKKERHRLWLVWEDEAYPERKNAIARPAGNYLKDRENFEAWLLDQGHSSAYAPTPTKA